LFREFCPGLRLASDLSPVPLLSYYVWWTELLRCNAGSLFGFFACLFSGRWCNQSRWKINLVIGTQHNVTPTREWPRVCIKWITNLIYFNPVRFENETSGAFLYCFAGHRKKRILLSCTWVITTGGCIPLSCLGTDSCRIVVPVTLKYLATNT